MSEKAVATLMVNAGLLMAAVLIFDNVLSPGPITEKSFRRQLMAGFLLGIIGMTVMFFPWEFEQGIWFDTRSVLLSVAGFFYGPLPATMAAAMTVGLRFWQGGAGAWTGVSVIIVSTMIGLIWRQIRYRDRSREEITWKELLLLGFTVHVTMLLLMFSLPWEKAVNILRAISLPVLTIYPLATLIVGVLFVNSIRRREYTVRLGENEQLLKRHSDMLTALLREGEIFQSSLDENIRRIVKLVGQTLHSSRTSVWFYSDDYQVIRCLCLYDLAKDEYFHGETLPLNLFPAYRDAHLQGRVIAAEDVRTNPVTMNIFKEYYDVHQIKSLMAFPIWSNGRLQALLSLEQIEAPRIWQREEEQTGQTLAALISSCLEAEERRVLEERLQRKNLYLDMLNVTSLSLMKRLNLDEIFLNIVSNAASFFACEEAWVSVLEPDKKTMLIRAMVGTHSHLIGLAFPVTQGLSGEVLKQGQTVLINDYQTWEGRVRQPEYEKRRSTIGVPLTYENHIAGVLCLAYHGNARRFLQEDKEVLERLAELANIALDNSRLYDRMMRNLARRKEAEKSLMTTTERLRKMLGGTVQAISMAVETKDPYTAGHQRRTSHLARAMAVEMGLPQEQVDFIRIAASIHDIGKIAVPAEILSKPTPLSDIEFGIIKTHAAQGFEILKDIDFPWPVAQVILQHHERMNGSGYPRGIRGDEILLEARIIMVADAVEAIASHRPYRPMLGIDAALEELRKNRGILFDEMAVDATLNLFNNKGYRLA